MDKNFIELLSAIISKLMYHICIFRLYDGEGAFPSEAFS